MLKILLPNILRSTQVGSPRRLFHFTMVHNIDHSILLPFQTILTTILRVKCYVSPDRKPDRRQDIYPYVERRPLLKMGHQ
jgi:hypothetical protein